MNFIQTRMKDEHVEKISTLKGEDIMEIMKDPMKYIKEANKHKCISEIKKDLQSMKYVIHNDIIKVLNKNSREFMSLPSNLNIIEKMIPVLEDEIKRSQMFVSNLLNEINTTQESTSLILSDKVYISCIKDILKNNLEIQQTLKKIQKEIKNYEKQEAYLYILNLQNKFQSYYNDTDLIINDCINEDMKRKGIFFLYQASQRIIDMSREVWKIRAMLYNNYKRIKKITSSLNDFDRLLVKYGTLAMIDKEMITKIIKKYSYEKLCEQLKSITLKVKKWINHLSYVYLHLIKKELIDATYDNFMFLDCTDSILNSCYVLNYFDTFVLHFQEVYMNYLEREPFESYEKFMIHIKEHIIEKQYIKDLVKRIEDIDENILFYTNAIVLRIMDLIERQYSSIFSFTSGDQFIETYVKTSEFFRELKKGRSSYEQYVMSERIKEFLIKFETEIYVHYILNVLEGKMLANYQNVVLFDKKYIFDNNVYWLRATINIVKIFKLLFTSKYYIASQLTNYLSFIFKHFKHYIDNIESFLGFIREHASKGLSDQSTNIMRNDVMGNLNAYKITWSPTLSYNNIGFFLSDFLTLRKVFRIECTIQDFISNGTLVIPENVGDIPKWIFEKLIQNSDEGKYDYEDSLSYETEEDKSSNSDSDFLNETKRDSIPNEKNSRKDSIWNNEEENKTSMESKELLNKLGMDKRNTLKEKRKEIQIKLHSYHKKNSHKIIHEINCIINFVNMINEIIIQLQKSFEDFFIQRMFELCSSFLIYLHSLLAMYKMTKKEIPQKPSEQVEKVILPLLSFKNLYKDIIASIIIDEIITKIVDKLCNQYLEEIKNIFDVKISPHNEGISEMNSMKSLHENDISDDEKIQRQIYLDVCYYEKLCNEHFNIHSSTSESMERLLNHFSLKN